MTDIILWLGGIVASAVFSWLSTHLYYRKSLEQQTSVASAQLEQLLQFVTRENQAAGRDQELLRQRRIEESIAEYRRAGTPVQVIDTYNDLTDPEKAELLDTVLLRSRGRKAKFNKYRAAQ